MEWSWRTVLILVGLIFMAAILLDGVRRMRRARAEALRLDVSNEFNFPEDGHNPELPGGGFRVVGDGDENDHYIVDNDGVDTDVVGKEVVDEDVVDEVVEEHLQSAPLVAEAPGSESSETEAEAASHDVEPVSAEPVVRSEAELPFTAVDDVVPQREEPIIAWEDDLGPVRVVSADKVEETLSETPQDKIQDLDIPQSPLIPKARPVNLDEDVPVLLDVEELGDDDVEPVYATTEELAGATVAESGENSEEAAETADEAAVSETAGITGEETDEFPADDNDPHLEREVESIPENLVTQPVNFADPSAESLADRPQAELVLEIHCVAHDPQGFSGKDILFLFNSCDLRFGEKQIFHRFEEADGKGSIQFSVAQSYEPGIFVPAAMAQQHFRGLSFFLSLPGARKPMEAYEAMSEMALVVARKLHADLYDSARSALTPQTIEHDRQQIMDYERRQKLAQKKLARH